MWWSALQLTVPFETEYMVTLSQGEVILYTDLNKKHQSYNYAEKYLYYYLIVWMQMKCNSSTNMYYFYYYFCPLICSNMCFLYEVLLP